MPSRRDIGVVISELGRRRVFRVAAWYTAIAVAFIGVSYDVFPSIGLGDAEKYVLWAAIIGAPITLVFAWIFDITPHGVQRTESLRSATKRVTIDTGNSLAVLPFANLGSEADAYFADGITEDIIAAVSCCQLLRVISRTSVMQYRSTARSIPDIARELDVAFVLEGSVRRAGDRVRIVAQLIDASSDEHRWAETYDRELDDVFAIQSDVARHVAQAVHAELTAAQQARIERAPTRRLDAYDAYLRGRHLWNQRTAHAIQEGIEWLEQAIAIDPNFALAHAALAESHVVLALYGAAAPAQSMPLATAAAERALQLDAGLAQALTPLAAVKLHYEWDWTGAERLFAQATAATGAYATAHHWYANLLAAGGRFDEARASLERARTLDPLSPAVLTNAGVISYHAREWDRAREELEAVIARSPTFALAHLFLGLTLDGAGRFDDAVSALRAAVQFSGSSVEARAALACALAHTGDATGARALLDAFAAEPYVSPMQRTYVLAALGDVTAAATQLAAAVDARVPELVWIRVRPLLDPLRETAAYRAAVHRVVP